MSFKTFVIQLFCDHIWEITKGQDLERVRRRTSQYSYTYANYQISARWKKCLKCGKEVIEEITRMIM